MLWYQNDLYQKATNDITATITRDVTLAYLAYSKEFEAYTDGSKKQLRAVIIQNNRLIAFFSWKLTQAQQKYSVTEIEVLVKVDTLKEFLGLLWGQKTMVYTNHEYLARDSQEITSDRVF